MAGLWYEQFKIGQTFKSPGRTVTEADIVNFAGLSGDFNPLHIDEEFAKKTPFGKRIAHGMLIVAIGSGLARARDEFSRTIAILGMEFKIKNPVYIGDTIHVVQEITGMRTSNTDPTRGHLEITSTILNQQGKPTIVGKRNVMVLRDPKLAQK